MRRSTGSTCQTMTRSISAHCGGLEQPGARRRRSSRGSSGHKVVGHTRSPPPQPPCCYAGKTAEPGSNPTTGQTRANNRRLALVAISHAALTAAEDLSSHGLLSIDRSCPATSTVGVITPSTPPQTGGRSQWHKDEEYMASSYCRQLTDRQLRAGRRLSGVCDTHV